MDDITYNVRIWKTEVYKGAKVTTYKVRWKTGDAHPWKEPFRNSAQAESFRSALVTAARYYSHGFTVSACSTALCK